MPTQNAIDLFGGPDQLAESIAEHVRSKQPVTAKLMSQGARKFFGSISRQEFFDFISSLGLAIDEIMPIAWGDGDRQQWLNRLNLGPNGGVGANGTEAPEDLRLETFVRWEALSDFCGTAKHGDTDTGYRSKINKLREKYGAAVV